MDPLAEPTRAPDVAGVRHRNRAGRAREGNGPCKDPLGVRSPDGKFSSIAGNRDVTAGVRIKENTLRQVRRRDVLVEILDREGGVGGVVDFDALFHIARAGDGVPVGRRTWNADIGEGGLDGLRPPIAPVAQEHHACRHRTQQPGTPKAGGAARAAAGIACHVSEDVRALGCLRDQRAAGRRPGHRQGVRPVRDDLRIDLVGGVIGRGHGLTSSFRWALSVRYFMV